MKRPGAAGETFTVGFVLFVALTLAMVTVFSIGGGGFFSDSVSFVAYLPTSSGLLSGSKVYLSGVPVGTVRSIDFAEDLDVNKVRVTLSVDKGIASRVRGDSRMWLATAGLLGDYSVHVSLGTPAAEALPPGSEIPYEERTMLEGMAGAEITASTEDMLRAMIAILRQIQAGQGTLGQLVTNPELYTNLNEMMASLTVLGQEIQVVVVEARDMVARIQSQTGIVGKLLFSEEYSEEMSATFDGIRRTVTGLEGAVEEVRGVVAAIRRGEGSAGRLLASSELHDGAVRALDEVESAARGIASLTGSATAPESVAGRVLRDPEMGERFAGLVARLDASARHLENILETIESGEGSLGVLLRDPSIATSLRDVFYGVQDMGYVRTLIGKAEEVGRAFAARSERDLRRGETEAVEEFLRGTAEAEAGRTQPTSGRDDRESSDR